MKYSIMDETEVALRNIKDVSVKTQERPGSDLERKFRDWLIWKSDIGHIRAK